MQAPVLGSFVVSLLLISSYSFSCAYSGQSCQGLGSYQGTCAQQVAGICVYTCADVVLATAPHRDYITTVLGALSMIQWDTEYCIY